MSKASDRPQKKKSEPPKPVEDMTGDEAMEWIFNKRVAKKLKDIARDHSETPPDPPQE